MKILVIDHPEGDFLSAGVHMGLCQEYGHENVWDWPYKRSFHGETHRYKLPSDRNATTSCWDNAPNWDCEDGADGLTSPFSWYAQGHPGVRRSLDEVAGNIDSFDVVILMSPRQYNSAALSELMRHCGGRGRIRRLAIVDGEDYTDVRWDFINKYQPNVYFKRELIQTYPEASCRVLPCPFVCTLDLSKIQEKAKDVDVCFLGGNTDPRRNEICDALRREFGDRFVGGVNQHRGYEEYLDILNRSKIAISIRGFGLDTLRFWDIPAFPHTMLICDNLPLIRPNDFQDGVHCAKYDGGSHAVATVRQYLNYEPGWRQVSEAGNQRLREYHTAKARARYVVEETLR